MKICPFISHLLGEDNSNTLTLDNRTGGARGSGDSSDVVILGYNDGDGPNAQTDVMTKTRMEPHASTHVECLKDSCRFYHKEQDECRFEAMLSKLDEMAARDDETAQFERLTSDIDKIWNFQTKGVAEIVESLAGFEKNQAENIDKFQTAVNQRLDSIDDATEHKTLEKVPDQIDALRQKLDSIDLGMEDRLLEKMREQFDALKEKLESNLAGADGELLEKMREQFDAFENKLEGRDGDLRGVSDKISEFVSHVDNNISDIRAISDDVMKQVKEMKRTVPNEDMMKKMITDALDENGPTAFDITTPMKAVELKIEDLQKQQEDSTAGLEKKLLNSIQNQIELEDRLDSWRGGIDAAVDEIRSLREEWAARIEEMTENNKRIAGYIEEGTKQREAAEGRLHKKESRKFNNLGVTSFHNGAYEMARDQFLKAVELDPDFAEAHNNLGLAYTELELAEKATESFGRAVELNPSLHAAYNNLGYIHYKQGDYAQAVELYNEALGRNTKNGPAYTNLGNAYYKLGRMDEARNAWEKALELDPGNEKARRNLERIGKDND